MPGKTRKPGKGDGSYSAPSQGRQPTYTGKKNIGSMSARDAAGGKRKSGR